MEVSMYDLIIIGAGPAGLSAAIYASRAKLNAVVIDKNYVSGGQINDTYEIDNYPGIPGISGMELAEKMSAHAVQLGAQIENTEVIDLDLTGPVKKVVADDGFDRKTFEAKAVILASGARHSMLGAPGEEKLAGTGVSYCATCDGAFYRNKEVVVVGGGDVAVEDAIFLARGCSKVYVVHRRDELRASKILQESLFALPNVEMVWNSVVTSINGDGHVESVTVSDVKDQSERVIPVSGAFIAVGIVPQSEYAKNRIAMDEKGYIIADETGTTNVPGVFAAGDIRTKQLRQVVTAVADGANAVTSAERYLIENR